MGFPISIEPSLAHIGKAERTRAEPIVFAMGCEACLDRAHMIADRPAKADTQPDSRLFDFRNRTGPNGLAVPEGTCPRGGSIEILVDGIVDHANLRAPIPDDAERHAPEGNSSDEIAGAVDRIDDPDEIAAAVSETSFFAEHRILRERSEHRLCNEFLTRLVRIRDHVLHALGRYAESFPPPIVMHGKFARFPHDLLGNTVSFRQICSLLF